MVGRFPRTYRPAVRRGVPSRPVRRIVDVARPGRVYLILTRPVDPDGMPIPGAPPEVGYIGQTRQQVWQRVAQHRLSQPFADLIVDVILLEQGLWTDAELDAREVLWIRMGAAVDDRAAQRPRYNIDHNRENPDRILPWVAVAHRQAREPGWTPPPKDGPRIPRQRSPRPTSRPVRPSAPRSHLDRLWDTYRTPVTVWASLWVGLFVAVWWAGRDAWTGSSEPWNAAVGATIGLGVLAYAYRRTVNRIRRERRRTSRRSARKRSRR